jgi:hypothetical protein
VCLTSVHGVHVVGSVHSVGWVLIIKTDLKDNVCNRPVQYRLQQNQNLHSGAREVSVIQFLGPEGKFFACCNLKSAVNALS